MGTGSTTTRAGASTAAPVAGPAVADTRTSTIVVAASNSLDPTLAPALYRCSGVNDEVEMNAALTAAAAVNGSVELLEGDYNTVLTLSVAVNVTLKAVGWGAVIHFNAGGNAITIAGDNVKLRDFKVVIVAGAGEPATRPNLIYATGRTNLEITKVWLIGDITVADEAALLLQNGILFETVTDSRVVGSRIEDTFRGGVYFNESDQNIVIENTMINCARGVGILASDYNAMDCNVIQGGSFGIAVYPGSLYNVISGNICEGADTGVLLNDVEGNTITGNTCQGNTKEGILIAGPGNTCTGNTCRGNGEQGIAVASDNCTISGNTCQGNSWSGIEVTSEYCTVSGNTCNLNERHGIWLNGGDAVTVVGNTCKENDVLNTGTYDGIHLHLVDDCIVIGNQCVLNDNYGINIDAGYRNVVKDNILRGNTAGPFIDGGTDTKLATKVFQFTEPVGAAEWVTVSPTGIMVEAADEGALACGEAPLEVQMAVRFRVKGVCKSATGFGKGMLLEININAGKPTGSEPYNAEAIAVAGVISTEDDVAVDDAIEWIIDAADDEDVDDIEFGETMEMFAMFENTGADSDIATAALIRTISMEYV